MHSAEKLCLLHACTTAHFALLDRSLEYGRRLAVQTLPTCAVLLFCHSHLARVAIEILLA